MTYDAVDSLHTEWYAWNSDESMFEIAFLIRSHQVVV